MHDTSSRREFLRNVSLSGAAAGLSGLATPLLRNARADAKPDRRLKILVLGGTGQTGPHLIRRLLDRGHEVTMFNRGNRSEELFPDVECIIGDRYPEQGAGLSALEAEVEAGRRWDVTMDIWPHIPKLVEATATLLKDNTKRYMFTSSLSVYADHSQPNQDETAEVGQAPNADDLDFNYELFGPFKAECENRVRRLFPEHHTIFRPGLIVGPRDFSFRGVYWPVRVRRGGEVLAPGSGDDRIQIIDGRDLTDFQVLCMERGTNGTFNVVGPHPNDPLTVRRLLKTCRRVSDSDATFTWVPADFLMEQQVGPWMQMPCWLPADGEYAGFGSRNIGKAIAAGLAFRPLSETVRDTLTWYDSLDDETRERIGQRAGLPAEREEEVLATWHEREEED